MDFTVSANSHSAVWATKLVLKDTDSTPHRILYRAGDISEPKDADTDSWYAVLHVYYKERVLDWVNHKFYKSA